MMVKWNRSFSNVAFFTKWIHEFIWFSHYLVEPAWRNYCEISCVTWLELLVLRCWVYNCMSYHQTLSSMRASPEIQERIGWLLPIRVVNCFRSDPFKYECEFPNFGRLHQNLIPNNPLLHSSKTKYDERRWHWDWLPIDQHLLPPDWSKTLIWKIIEAV